LAEGSVLFDGETLRGPSWTFPGAHRATRYLADMREYYPDDAAAGSSNPLIYEVFEWPGYGLSTDLMITVTVIHPGRVGGEPHHTKGHFHQDPDGSELVIGLKGQGRLEMVDRSGAERQEKVVPGTYIEVPPGWAHRVFNPGDEPLLYVSISSAGIGHDYESVTRAGWIPGKHAYGQSAGA
jgi:oxalate decarboxylase/phosphoglucose isomerase-like protein (cupin superfamily)